MVFNTTLNTNLVILWWSVLLVDETGVPGENHRPAAHHYLNNVFDKLKHLNVSQYCCSHG